METRPPAEFRISPTMRSSEHWSLGNFLNLQTLSADGSDSLLVLNVGLGVRSRISRLIEELSLKCEDTVSFSPLR